MLSAQKRQILMDPYENPWETPKPVDKKGGKRKSKRKKRKGHGRSSHHPKPPFLIRFFHAFHNDPNPHRTFVWICLFALALWLATGFYRIQPNDKPIVLHLGNFTQTVSEPGWHYRLPSPIVTVTPKTDDKPTAKCNGIVSDTRV